MFGRRKPLHRQLADAADLSLGFEPPATPGQAAEPPGWDGEARGEPGIHGIPRPRRWDAVTHADAPGVHGDVVHFVALADQTLIVEEDEPDGAVEALAESVERAVAAPYRAEAVRRRGDAWAVGASRIEVIEVRGLTGDRAELVLTRDGRALHVDGRPSFGRAPALERAGEAQGSEYVVRASRLDGALWEVEATPL
jgi:hypothetical protein